MGQQAGSRAVPPGPRVYGSRGGDSTPGALARAARSELRQLRAALADRRLGLLLGLLALLFLLAAQLPLRYRIEVGQEDGPGGDLPLIAGFNTAEHDSQGTYRWTTGESSVRLPGIGMRPALLTIRTASVNDQMAAQGPQSFTILAGGHELGPAGVRPRGGVYRVLLAPPGATGDQEITLRSATAVPSGDVRALGIIVDWVQIHSGAGPTLPPLRSATLWLAAAACAWLTVRRAGYGSQIALWLLLAPVTLMGLAMRLDPLRLALGAAPALAALGLAWLLTIGLDRCGRGALGALGISISGGAWRALCLLGAATFALRYGGKIYPDAMPGDIGFHVNRFADTLRGTVFLLSRNRGVDFPYPPALYLALAPLSLALDRMTLLRLAAATLDALGPLLVYLIATRGRMVRSWQFGVAAGGLYALCGAGFMPTWWNFSTHIFAQFAHLLLIAALVLAWGGDGTTEPRTENREQGNKGTREQTIANPAPSSIVHRPSSDRPPAAKMPPSIVHRPLSEEPPATEVPSSIVHRRSSEAPSSTVDRPSSVAALAGLILIQCVVYLGHFGFWVNTTLLALIGLGGMAWGVRGRGPGLHRLLGALIAAQLLAALLFYSAYTGLFIEQIGRAAAGGLNDLAGRAPVSRAILWQTLSTGLYAHVGLLPIPLAIAALAAGRGSTPLRTLMAGTFLIGVCFAALPFLTGSTLSTRWLMFAIWAIAVGAAAAAERLWRAGRAGRLAVWAVGGYVIWLSAAMWVGALAWRVRPPEPF